MLGTILLVFAFVFACIAACIPGPIQGRWHLGWLSLAFFYASLIFGDVLRLTH
jgi:hypothetical protein